MCIKDIDKKDIRIKNDKYNFHYRVAGLIEKDNKFLILQIEGYDYYILPGGHVLLGESSYEAIIREIKEEVGLDIMKKDCKLFCNHENFYLNKRRQEHWIENYFLIHIEEELKEQWQVKEKDGDEIKILNFKFMTIEEIKNIELKPTSIKKILIDREYNNFNHIINGK